MASLEVRNLVKNFGLFEAVRNVSFDVAAGEFIVIVGPSGCGKSTLLRIIAGLEGITSGEIRIKGRDITHEEPSDRGVAMVFQNYALYPHMTIRQNMGFGLKISGRPRNDIDKAVERAAETLRITEQLDKRPRQLSGGQRQRVAIGRAITRAPDVFLFDEPLSNLDAALRSQMRVELGRLHTELNATMLYVTHDQTEAMTMADRIIVLNHGVIEQNGSPLELYNRPRNKFVAGFIGSPRMNFLPMHVVGVKDRTIFVELDGVENPAGLELTLQPGVEVPQPGETLTGGIRPEGFGTEADKRLSFEARIAVIENLGRETLLFVDAGPIRARDSESHEGYLAIHRSSQVPASHGDTIQVSIEPEKLFLFNAEGNAIRFANH